MIVGGSDKAAPGMDISLLAAYGFDDAIIDIWRKFHPKLLPIQARAVAEFGLFSGQNLLIFAPTSSGKTFIGEMAAVGAARRKTRAFYLLPLRSLAEEKFDQFQAHYARIGLKTVVSSRDRREFDRQIEEGDFDIAIVVFEKMDSLLLTRPTILENVGVVVVDEMQMLSDETRGPRLELLLSKILRIGGKLQLIGLSAVLSKASDIREWTGARLLEEHARPVELRKGVFCEGTFYYILHNEGAEGQEQFGSLTDMSISCASLSLVEELVGRDEQCIVFLRDKTSTIEMARAFAERSHIPAAEHTLEQLRDLTEESSSKELLLSLLANGIAFHNADLDYQQRRAIESGVRRGEVRVIFSTSTLGMGINLPVKNVLIDHKRWRYSKEFKQMHLVDITRGEYENLSGRAGRLSLEPDFGRSFLVTSAEFDVKRLTDMYVTGSFEEAMPRLHEMLLEDIILNLLASRIVGARSELAEFLLSTYTGRNFWAKSQAPTPQAARSRLELDISEAIQNLIDWELINSEHGDNLQVMELGLLIARASITARTGLSFAGWAKESRSIFPSTLELLLLIASATDALGVYVPLSRSEWQNDKYVARLRTVAADEAAQDRPMIAELLGSEKRPSFDQTRSIKRSLLMLDWISEAPLSDLEHGYYNVWPGLIHRIGETDSWLCDSLLQMCRLYNWPAKSLEGLEHLVDRLSLGVMDDAIPLSHALGAQLGRPRIRKLVNAKIRTVSKLRKTDSSRIAELVGFPAATRLASRFGLRPPQVPVKADRDAEHVEPDIAATESPEAEFEDNLLTVNCTNLSVTYKGLVATLTPKTFKLLRLLAEHAPGFVHKERIYEALWGSASPDSFPYEKQIADHKGKLLKAMLAAAEVSAELSPKEIRGLFASKYGVGYRLTLAKERVRVVA
ncbi:DEAD/DEAH box helicase [bacterium]|nr:DEAD/DEAH box helicase [bacterium]